MARLLESTISSDAIQVIKKSLDKNYPENKNLNFSDDKSEVVLRKIDKFGNFSFNKKILSEIIFFNFFTNF
mgnify:CR=1 FL=1